MSYTIYFYKKRAVDQDKFLEILEGKKGSPSTEISIKDFIEVKDKIKEKLQCDVISGSGSEITFDNFQINRYENYVTLSIPFWRENTSQKEIANFYEVIDAFRGKGFGGFDQQSEQFINDEHYNFNASFTQSCEVVISHFLKNSSHFKK